MSSMLRRRAAMAALTLLAMGPGQAALSQRPASATPDSVPLEFVVAAMQSGATAFMRGGVPQITVGAIPADYAVDLFVPSDARVLGTVSDNAAMYAFLYTSEPAESVRERFERELLARGWRHPPPPAGYGGGFRSYPLPRNTLPGSQPYCRGLLTLTLTVVSGSAGPANVVLREETNSQNATCTRTSNFPSPGMTVGNQLPTLFNPVGSGDPYSSACYGGSASSSTNLDAGLSPDSVLAHYARQLVDSGWKPLPGSTVVGGSWTRADSAGTVTTTTVTVGRVGPNGRCLEARMTARKKNGR